MKLCEFLEVTREKVNIIDPWTDERTIVCQIRNADLASLYLDTRIYQAEVINVERSNEYGSLDVTIGFNKEE